jgi:hypothetical protein
MGLRETRGAGHIVRISKREIHTEFWSGNCLEIAPLDHRES